MNRPENAPYDSERLNTILLPFYNNAELRSGSANIDELNYQWVLSENRGRVRVTYRRGLDPWVQDVPLCDVPHIAFLEFLEELGTNRPLRENDESEIEVETKTEHPYSVERGRLTFTAVKYDRDGKPTYTSIPLSNFDAWIYQAITYDDGAEQRKYFELDGALENAARLPRVAVGAEVFPRMEWVSQWDGRAVVRVGSYIKDHTRAAIQFLSNDRGYSVRYVYSHAGWRLIDNKWQYLHAGGAINENGLDGGVDVEFKDTRLAAFNLPEPPKSNELKEVVLSVIALLDDATLLDLIPEWCAYFDVAKVFRAPLNEVLPITTSDFLAGRTGVRKTAYKAVFQAFYGAEFNAGSLPGNWSSTENQIERLLYIFKDALCEIDDFKPQGNATQIQKTHVKADRVFRGHANKQGRGRLRANSDFAPTYYSRAFPSSSGEDVPTGQSLRGRMLIRELSDGDIDLEWLTGAQELAASGVYVKVMSAYIQWLAPRIEELKKSNELHELYTEKRSEYSNLLRESGAHAQTPGALADVYLGFVWFMRFAVDVGVISEERRDELTSILEAALLTIGSYQGSYIRSEEPTTQFIDLIGALLSSGRAHLCDGNTNEVPELPNDPRLLGWILGRERTQTDNEGYLTTSLKTWVAQGPCIGWIDECMIYLEPSMAYAEAQKLARDQGANVPFTKSTLYKRMKEQMIIEGDIDDSHTSKVKWINGKSKRVLWIEPEKIIGEADDKSKL
jgi:hypothetical protein